MHRVIVGILVAGSVMWPSSAGSVECSPGPSPLRRDFTHPAVTEVPVRVFGGWSDGKSITNVDHVLLGVRDRDHTWRAQASATTAGASVDGEHQDTVTGWQVAAGADGSVNVCVHAAGQTVQQRR